ncbi:hypothetical protein O3M35_011687 [Rhynocoris fuscipes]|uniref:Uncharacterized protein n=1 Tax=Rhynocoris fuscipes TaxID=488301 RepID=A0AAW1D3C0_9HEMI
MENLEKVFWDYFIYLPEHVNKWKLIVEDKFPFMKALKNQLEQYRLVKSKKWNDENLLNKFPQIENKLLEKILSGIEQEMIELRKLQTSLASLNRELFRKHDAISKLSKNDISTEFTSKGSLVPPFWQLIELADNSKNYYAALYLKLDIEFTCLKYEDLDTISDFEDTLLELSKTVNEVQDAIALTAFCRE